MLQWKNDFESPGSIYVNTNRKYSPGNLLELEASHLLEPELCNAVIIQKTNKRITYSPVPETKYNLAESCVNMWWNFAVLFCIKLLDLLSPAIGFSAYLKKHRRKGFVRKNRSFTEFSLLQSTEQSQISSPFHCDVSHFQHCICRSNVIYFIKEISRNLSQTEFLSLKKGYLGAVDYLLTWGCNQRCSGALGCTQNGTLVADPHVPGLLEKIHQRLLSLQCSWNPCSALMENLPHSNITKLQGPNQRKSWHAQRWDILSSGYFWSWLHPPLKLPFATNHRNSPLKLP